MELYAYRHKVYKDFWLVRNGCSGGGPNTSFYNAREDVVDALASVARYGDKFEDRFVFHYIGKHEGTSTPVVIRLRKSFSFDGYEGVMEKVVNCTTDDFEKVVFREAVE